MTRRRESRVLKQTATVRLSWSALLRAAWAGTHILCDTPFLLHPPHGIPLSVTTISLVSSRLCFGPVLLHSAMKCYLSACFFISVLSYFHFMLKKKTVVLIFDILIKKQNHKKTLVKFLVYFL